MLENGLATAMIGGYDFLAEQLRSSLVHALAFAGRITDAERLASSRYDESAARPTTRSVSLRPRLPLGQLDLWLGRPRTALRRLGEALARMGGHDLVGYIPYAHAHLAWARAWIDPGRRHRRRRAGGRVHPGYAGALLESVARTAYAQAELAGGHLTRAEQSARDAGLDRARVGAASARDVRAPLRVSRPADEADRGRDRRARPGTRARSPPSSSSRPAALAADDPAQLEAAGNAAAALRSVAARVRTLRARALPPTRAAAPRRPPVVAAARRSTRPRRWKHRRRSRPTTAARTRALTAREREVAAARRRGADERRDRGRARRVGAHGAHAPAGGVPQARRQPPRPARGRSFKGLSTPVPMTCARGRDLIKPCRPSECPNCSSSCSSSC